MWKSRKSNFQISTSPHSASSHRFFATPRSENSASHERSTYGCTCAISQTSGCLNSDRLGIWTVSGNGLPPVYQTHSVESPRGTARRRDPARKPQDLRNQRGGGRE